MQPARPLQPEAPGTRTAQQLVESPEFRALVSKRWAVSLVLLGLLFVAYYGYILLVGARPDLLKQKIGAVTTVGIPLGVASIVAAWILTGAYVWWANRKYDPEVERLKRQLAP